jgi:hypothetical protein
MAARLDAVGFIDACGFSQSRPWLPVHPDYVRRNVAGQRADPDSLFHFTRSLLHLRKSRRPCSGEFVPLHQTGGAGSPRAAAHKVHPGGLEFQGPWIDLDQPKLRAATVAFQCAAHRRNS